MVLPKKQVVKPVIYSLNKSSTLPSSDLRCLCVTLLPMVPYDRRSGSEKDKLEFWNEAWLWSKAKWSVMLLEAWWAFAFEKIVLFWGYFFKSATSLPEHFSVWACLLALEHNWYCWCKEEQHKRDVLLLYVTQTQAQVVSLWLLPSWYIVFQCTIVVYIVLYFHLYRYWIWVFFPLPSGLFLLCFSIKQLDVSTQLRNLLFACLITFQPNNNKVIPSVWNDVVNVSESLSYTTLVVFL